MRKVEIALQELMDIYFAGRDGEMEEYLLDFLKKDLHITKEDWKEYAEYYKTEEAKKHGYGVEDYEAVLDFAEDW